MFHHLETTKKQFIGLGIASIERLSESDVKIHFSNGKSSVLSVEGDCCSHSCFYEIDFPEQCKNSPIIDVLEREDGDSEEIAVSKAKALWPDFYTEEQSVWDVVFKTQAGEIRIRHINVSNGYYDGRTLYTEVE